MRGIRTIRESKGITIDMLSVKSGVSTSAIWKYETGKTKMNNSLLEKIAKVLKTTIKKLDEKIIKEYDKEICKSRPCFNEKCPLNKNKMCDNPVVLSGRAPCYGKDKLQPKGKDVKFNNTQALFIK